MTIGSSLRRRLSSFRYAGRGLATMLRSEPNARIHALAAVAACKTSVAEYTSTKTTLPGATQGGCSDNGSQYVVAGGGWDGTAIVYSSTNTGAQGTECTFTLTPAAPGTDGAISAWTGTAGGCASKYVPASFR